MCVLEGITDITSLYEFFLIEPPSSPDGMDWRWLFHWNLALCSATVVAHMVTAAIQFHRKGKWVVLNEWLYIICFIKPMVDAYRVVVEHERRDPNLVFDALTVYVRASATKVLEGGGYTAGRFRSERAHFLYGLHLLLVLEEVREPPLPSRFARSH